MLDNHWNSYERIFEKFGKFSMEVKREHSRLVESILNKIYIASKNLEKHDLTFKIHRKFERY